MKQNGDSIQLIREELKEAQGLLEKFIASEEMLQCVSDIAAVMINAIQEGGKIISCGNGGSHCDAVHFAEELTGGTEIIESPSCHGYFGCGTPYLCG